MPTTVKRLIGHSGSTGGRSRTYLVDGAASEAAALTAALDQIITDVGATLALDGFALRGLDYRETGREGCYSITAGWGREQKPDPPETNSFSLSFDFSTQPQRIVVPINPITVYDADGEVADHGIHLIGETGLPDEPPEGVEIPEPTLSFSKTVYKPADFVDNDYLDTLSTLVGHTNTGSFMGFAAGRLLSIGVSGSRRTIREDWELQFKFAARKHQTDLTIAGITVAVKKGWDFLWPIRARELIGAGAKQRYAQQIKAIAVTSPLPSADYAGFDIGA